MGFEVWWTPYGRPAADALRARVDEAKRGDPLAPVTVIVPTNFVGVSMRRYLGSVPGGGGVAGLRMATVFRLAELLGAPRLAAAGRRPVSTPVVAAAVRAELAVAPGVLAEVKDHPSTEQALVRAHRELGELDQQALDRLARQSERAALVVSLCQRVRGRLGGGWYDEHDLVASAVEAVRGGASLVDELGATTLYLPQRLGTRPQALLRELAMRREMRVIAGTTGDPVADAEVRRTLDGLGISDPPPSEPARADVDADTDVIVTSDADDEVRACVRAVVDAARHGVAFERMAVLYPSAEPYARLVAEQMKAAGVPTNGPAVRSPAERVAGRWLLDVMALPDRDAARDQVLGVLAATPGAPGAGCRHPIAEFERISRMAGVVSGDDWEHRLRTLGRRCRQEAADEEASPEPRETRVSHLVAEADHTDALAAHVRALRSQLAEGRALRSWADLARWARGLLDEHCADEDAREGWLPAERHAAARVDAALDRLAELDPIDPRPTMTVFRRTLEIELDEDHVRDGRFGEGVLVGPVAAGLGLDLDLVVVCGMAESVLPAHVREDSLLPDIERAVAAELPLRVEQIGTQRRDLVAALAAGRHRVLGYPRGDLRRSAERPPSRWLLDAVAHLPAERRLRSDGRPDTDVLPRTASWLRRVPSFDAGIRRSEPATEQEYRLRALSEARAQGTWIDDHPLAVRDSALRAALATYRGRTAARLTRFDGDLSNLPDLGALVPSPAESDGAIAPTRLEGYARCPHAYLMEHVLRIRPVEDPEEQLQISPLELGSLVHEILDRWLCEVLADPPGHGVPYTSSHRARLLQIGAECCDEFVARGVTGHPRLWAAQRRRVLRDLERFVDHDDDHRAAHGLRPGGTEMAFGIGGDPPVTVALSDGRKMRFRGRLDRLDADADGGIVVTDYKTGSGNRDEYRWLREDPVARGRLLQLPVYALAARQLVGGEGSVRAQYWFCTEPGGFTRRTVDLDTDNEDRFRSVLATLIRGMESGYFPAMPPAPSGKPYVECAYCDPDGFGTAERRRDWERKRRDPRLAELADLAEPEDEEEDQ